MHVVCAVDEDLRGRGVFTLDPPLRSLLRNFCTQLRVALLLPTGEMIESRFHKVNSTYTSKNLARWLRREKIPIGHRLHLEIVGPEVMNAFRVTVLEPSTEVPEEAEVVGEDEFGPSDAELAAIEGAGSTDEALDKLDGPKRRRRAADDDAGPEARPPPPVVAPTLDPEAWEALTSRLQSEAEQDASALGVRLLAEQARCRVGFENLWGLDRLQGVDLYEHQLGAVNRVLSEFHGRAILADEVGLGKTIEAGMILSEYLERGMIKNFLILSPASLVRQWQEELRTKFQLEATTHLDGDDWAKQDFLVVSLDTAKGPRHSAELVARGFDLVVVDEAHKLKNQRTRNWKFVRDLESRFLLLLTATPIQNSIEELYNLIYLARPGLLSTRKSFRAEFVQARNRRVPRNVQKLREMVGQVMVRSRRSEANLEFTDRKVDLIEVPMRGAEGELYEALDRFLREHYTQLPWFEKGLNRLTLMLLQRMVTSSPQALAGTVERLIEKGTLPATFQVGLEEIAQTARSITIPAKVAATCEVASKRGERILVYTQFRDSQSALADALESKGLEVFRFHGGLPIKAKDTVIRDFAKSEKGVLVSTDAGAEGRNLQFCRTLVNFDLPWNPMKVEQRIGRVHRLGQTRDVEIVNLYYQESIEEYVVRLLTEKIKLFTLVVGELDSILGLAKTRSDLEHEIMDVYMSTEDDRELDYRFDRLGKHFEKALDDYDNMRTAQNEIFDEGERESP